MKKDKNKFNITFFTVIIVLLFLLTFSYIIWYLFQFPPVTEVVKEPEIELVVPVQPLPVIPIEPPIQVEIPPQEEVVHPIIEEKIEQIPPIIEEIPQIIEEVPPIVEEVIQEPIIVEEVEPEPEIPVEVRVPEAPLLFDPFVFFENEEDFFFIPAETTKPVYDDDFFADLYIEGVSDSLALEAGEYYFTLLVFGERYGTIGLNITEDGQRLLNVAELKYNIGDILTPESYENIFANMTDFTTVEELDSVGVYCEINESAFTVSLGFSIEAIPERTLSVSTYNSDRLRQFALTGAVQLDPAFFTWVTALNLYGNANLRTDLPENNSWYGSLSASNYLSIGGINLDFFYSLSINPDDVLFNFGNYRFFKDFTDHNIRITWGNIYGYSLSPNNAVAVGVQFEKNYSYGTGVAKSNQYSETVTIVEDSIINIESNGNEIFSRRLSPGIYKLQDFLFDSGINKVTIRIYSAADPTILLEEKTIEFAYDSILMAKGESLYGGSLSIGRVTVDKKELATGLAAPSFYEWGKYFDYHIDNMAINWWQDIGISDNASLKTGYGVLTYPVEVAGGGTTPGFRAIANYTLINANVLGTTSFKVDLGLNGDTSFSNPKLQLPLVSGRIDHRFLIEGTIISSLSGSLGYSNPAAFGQEAHEFTGSMSTGGKLGFLRYSLTGSINLATNNLTKPNWRINTSFSMNPIKSMSLSTSLSLYSNANLPVPAFSGSISLSYSFGNSASVSASNTFSDKVNILTDNTNVTFYTPIGKDRNQYFQLNLNGFNVSDPLNHTLAASYSYSGELFNVSLRAQTYDNYKRYIGNFNVSTATVFVDGVFTMTRSARDNFLVIKPTGIIKGGAVSVSKSTDTKLQALNSYFGAATYTGINTNTRNNIIAYVTGEDAFADTESYAYELNPRSRAGYLLKVTVPPTFTVSGILLDEKNEPLAQYSSPIAKLVIDEETGEEYLVQDPNLYLFTDQDGRYILSGIGEGTYFFDLQVGLAWYAVYFTVDETEDEKIRVYEYETFSIADTSKVTMIIQDEEGNLDESLYGVFGAQAAYEYNAVVGIEKTRELDSSTFWNEIFPPFEEGEWNEWDDFSQDGWSDWTTSDDQAEWSDEEWENWEDDGSWENWDEDMSNIDWTTVPSDSTNNSNAVFAD